MRVGTVEGKDSKLSLFLNVVVFDNHGKRHWLRPLLDTGFDGGLTLPGAMIETLGLEYLHETPSRLANGTIEPLATYRVKLLWRDAIEETEVYRTEGTPLLGMDMMRGLRIEFDAMHLGEIVANPIDLINQSG